jgi:Glycosyltransferase family 87
VSGPLIPSTARSLPARQFSVGLNEETFEWFGVAVILLGAVIWLSSGPLIENTDFSMMYVGARIVHQGQGAKLYDLREQIALRDSLFKHPNPLFYEHPPFEALLFAPLAALPYRTAYLIWGLVNAFVWLVLPYLVRPYAPVPRETLGYFALWLLFGPLLVALFQGQPSLVLLLVYTLTFMALKRRQDAMAGFCLGLGLFRFQFVLPFALIFLFRQKWRFLAGFLFTAVLLGGLSLVAVGWHGVMSYVHLLLNVGSNPDSISYGRAIDMPTLHGFVYAILQHRTGPKTISFMVAVASLLLILFTAQCWRRKDRINPDDSLDVMYAAAVAVSLMTGFHMFTHDLSPLILGLFLAAAHFPGRERPALRVILATLLVLFWIPQIYFGLFSLVALHGLFLMFPLLLIFALTAQRLTGSAAGGMLIGEKPKAEGVE